MQTKQINTTDLVEGSVANISSKKTIGHGANSLNNGRHRKAGYCDEKKFHVPTNTKHTTNMFQLVNSS